MDGKRMMAAVMMIIVAGSGLCCGFYKMKCNTMDALNKMDTKVMELKEEMEEKIQLALDKQYKVILDEEEMKVSSAADIEALNAYVYYVDDKKEQIILHDKEELPEGRRNSYIYYYPYMIPIR